MPKLGRYRPDAGSIGSIPAQFGHIMEPLALVSTGSWYGMFTRHHFMTTQYCSYVYVFMVVAFDTIYGHIHKSDCHVVYNVKYIN